MASPEGYRDNLEITPGKMIEATISVAENEIAFYQKGGKDIFSALDKLMRNQPELAAYVAKRMWETGDLNTAQLIGEVAIIVSRALESTHNQPEPDIEYEDEFSLAETPAKEVLEDFLRGLSGKKPLHGNRPIYNLKTHKFER